MFSTQTNSDGITTAVIDFSAVSTSGLGNLISLVSKRLETELENITFSEATLDKLLNTNKFSQIALAMINDGLELDTVVEYGNNKEARIIQTGSGEGYKSHRNRLIAL